MGPVRSSREAELQALVERLAGRVGRSLERQDLLVRDAENDFLELGPAAGGAMDDLIGHSITYRVAVGPRAGQKVFALQTVPARAAEPRPGVSQYARFSLHAGIGVEADQRAKLERLARYVSRPPVSIERLEPVDCMARLAALVPPPRKHLTRFHGVFAPHAALPAAVTPAGRGSGAHSRAGTVENPTPRHLAMSWARRLQRVFGIDIERCARCGGRLKVIASIEDPEVIARILAHRRERGGEEPPVASLGPRAPPPGMSGMLF